MVFHITNYMRETNVWMIRKMRWVLWGFILSPIIYRNVYWDYLGRRVAWKNYWGWNGTDEERKKKAEELAANWGYKPRYEPVHDFSLKARKYETQTDIEKVHDTPRLTPTGMMQSKRGYVPAGEVR